jgi:hypothetical protein
VSLRASKATCSGRCVVCDSEYHPGDIVAPWGGGTAHMSCWGEAKDEVPYPSRGAWPEDAIARSGAGWFEDEDGVRRGRV